MRRALAFICVVGCNQVFGLEETESFDPIADMDGDGVADDVDNCATVANADQANGDSDEFGDICDTCPQLASSSVHDEDRDHVGDDCDVCPGVPDFGEDRDGDGIGDVCEVRPSVAERRIAFEGFASPPAGWTADSVPWTQSEDSLAPDVDLPAADSGYTNSAIVTPAGVWSAGIGVTSRTHWQPPDRYGVIARNAGRTFACEVKCAISNNNATACNGYTIVDGAINSSLVIVPRPYARVRIVANAGQAFCLFDANAILPAPSFPTDGTSISIEGSPRIRVAYFEFIE